MMKIAYQGKLELVGRQKLQRKTSSFSHRVCQEGKWRSAGKVQTESPGEDLSWTLLHPTSKMEETTGDRCIVIDRFQ